VAETQPGMSNPRIAALTRSISIITVGETKLETADNVMLGNSLS
jgi:hypothetical protein